MKICFVCPEYPEGPHGGIGTMVQILSRELVKDGHEVRVIGVYPKKYPAPDSEEDQNVRVWRIRLATWKFGWILPYIKQFKIVRGWIKNGEIDIVEAPDSRGWFAFWPKLPIPIILRAHGSNSYIARVLGKKPNRITAFLERQSYKRADGIVSVSKYSAKVTSEVFKLKRKFTIIYNGIEIPLVSNEIPREKNKIVFSGSLNRNKGVFNLIKAFAFLIESESDVSLEIYGKDTIDVEVGSVLNHIANSLSKNLSGKIRFMGHVNREELFNVYRTATMAVFPSFVESFSMAPLESMACGCPTIYTILGSGPEVIENGIDGILINPTEIVDITTAMLKILKDPILATKIGENGILKIKSQFSKEIMKERTIDFYKSIINNQVTRQK